MFGTFNIISMIYSFSTPNYCSFICNCLILEKISWPQCHSRVAVSLPMTLSDEYFFIEFSTHLAKPKCFHCFGLFSKKMFKHLASLVLTSQLMLFFSCMVTQVT